MKKKVTPKNTIKKSLICSRSKKIGTKPIKKKYAVLRFDLEDEYEWQSFKNAMKADHMADKIELLYQEIFRTHIKYDSPLECDGKTHIMDKKTTEIIWAIWDKCEKYFNSSEE